MFRKLLLPAVLLWGMNVSAQEAWDLQKCITYAVGHNLQVVQQQLSEKITENNHLQSELALLPNLNATGNNEITGGRTINPTSESFTTQSLAYATYNVTTNLTLFNGLRQLNTIAENKLLNQASHFQTEYTKNNIELNVTQAFLTVMMNKEALKSSLEQVAISQNQLTQSKQQYDAGVIPEGTFLHAESQLANDSVSLVTSQNGLDISLVNLALMMPVEPKGFDISAPPLGDNVPVMDAQGPEDIYQFALKNQPQVIGANYSVKSAEKAIAIAKGAQSPTISALGTLYSNYSSAPGLSSNLGNFEKNPTLENLISAFQTTPASSYFTQLRMNLAEAAGISISIPIFNNWQLRTNINNARVKYLQQKASSEAVQVQLRQDIYKAYADAKAAAQKYSALVKSVQSLQTTFNYAQTNFDLGASNAVDYTTAKSNLAIAQLNLIQAKYDYIFKLKVLDFYEGKPITLNQ